MKLLKLLILTFIMLFALVFTVNASLYENEDDIVNNEITTNEGIEDRRSRLDDIPMTTTVSPEEADPQAYYEGWQKIVTIPFFTTDELITTLEKSMGSTGFEEYRMQNHIALYEYESDEFITLHWITAVMDWQYYDSGEYVGKHQTEWKLQQVSAFSEVYYKDIYGQYNTPFLYVEENSNLNHGDRDNMSAINQIAEYVRFPMRYRQRNMAFFGNIPENFDRSKMVAVEDPPGYMPASERTHWIAYEDIALVFFDKFYDDVNDERYQDALDSLIFIDTDGRMIMPDGTVRILGTKTN